MLARTIFYDWNGANKELFLYFNNLFAGDPLASEFLAYFSLLGRNYIVPIILILMVILILANAYLNNLPQNQPVAFRKYLLRWAEILAVICCALLLVGIIIPLVKLYFAMPRPLCNIPPNQINIIVEVGEHSVQSMVKSFCVKMKSFPSAHSMIAAIFAIGLWPVASIYARALLIFSMMLMGISRMAIGVHYPADVIGGYILGLIFVVISRKILVYSKKSNFLIKLFKL
jgi:signal peptidase II